MFRHDIRLKYRAGRGRVRQGLVPASAVTEPANVVLVHAEVMPHFVPDRLADLGGRRVGFPEDHDALKPTARVEHAHEVIRVAILDDHRDPGELLGDRVGQRVERILNGLTRLRVGQGGHADERSHPPDSLRRTRNNRRAMRSPLRRKPSPDPLAATVLDGKLVDVLPLLRCPRTGSELKPAEDGSLVADSRRRYPVVNGVPVLIDEDRSLADSWTLQTQLDPDDDVPDSGLRSLIERWERRLPTSSRDVATKRNHRRLVELLRVRAASGRRPSVLVVGGPGEGGGSQELLRCSDLQVIEADLTFGPRADVVCDGHDLPFADRSFDAVVIGSGPNGLAAGITIAGQQRSVLVVDPYHPTPYGPSHYYWISVDRVVGSILLGIVTHDANLLVIHPPPSGAATVEPIAEGSP